MGQNPVCLEQRDGSEAEFSQLDQEVLDTIPKSAGPRIITQRGGAFYSVRPPGSQIFVPKDHFIAIMLAPAMRVTARLGSDREQEYDAMTGQVVINPAHVDSSLIWPSTRENAVIALTQETLQELAADEFDSGNAMLEPPPFGTIDPTALQIAQLLMAELARDEGADELYVDSLITVFGIHLLRNYTSGKKPPSPSRGGLSNPVARRVQEYLNENFSRRLSVKELAAIAGLSPKHFIHAFTTTFGAAPHRYLINLRLDYAERLLKEETMTIAEIAYISGFSSQSHLTAAMKKYRHTTPSKLRLAR